jgi:hypothetical protein
MAKQPTPRKSKSIRKIIMLNEHEWLHESFASKQMNVAAPQLEARVRTPGMRFDPTGYPVQMEKNFVVAAEFDDEGAVERFVADNPNDVDTVFSDCEIGHFQPVCPTNAVGTHQDVQTALNLTPLLAAGAQGTGVRIVVVDTGIDGSQINVVGGYNPRPGVGPGTAPPDHGTMVAFDAQLAAPQAMIFDYALLQSQGGLWVGFLSDAIRAFSEIMVDHLTNPGPMVVVNSWGMYDTFTDAPVGNPQNYSSNPSHPFNQITGALVGSGVDVVFAAGNCGSTCPDGRCGTNNTGPGNSIMGANSHPDVITVAAVTVNQDLLGYSSEGPGVLEHDKPDIAGFSHFSGSQVFPADSGTSAACPVVAGVIAALRSSPNGRNISPQNMKDVLTQNANATHGTGWDPQFGAGIVDAGAAFNALP